MKIEIVKPNSPLLTFMDIEIGQVFIFNGDYYLKLQREDVIYTPGFDGVALHLGRLRLHYFNNVCHPIALIGNFKVTP